MDTNSRQLLPSSALAVETRPRGATVLLNGQTQQKTTPYIDTISPGEYVVELQKDGAHPWKKQLLFETGRSHLFPNVLLFAEHSPVVDPSAANTSPMAPLAALSESDYRIFLKSGWSDPSQLLVAVSAATPLVVVDPAQQTSYVLDNGFESFTTNTAIAGTVVDADINNEKVIVYATEFELWTKSNASSHPQLITRRSLAMSEIEWHMDGGYIFFTDAEGVSVIELDERGQRQVWRLATIRDPRGLSINSRGDVLRFFSDGVAYRLDILD